MESSGQIGRIQVEQSVARILADSLSSEGKLFVFVCCLLLVDAIKRNILIFENHYQSIKTNIQLNSF